MPELTLEVFSAQLPPSVDEIKALAASKGYALKGKSRDALVKELYVIVNAASPAAEYEGRVRGQLSRRLRAGYTFTPVWTKLVPAPNEAQLKKLADDDMVQLRASRS